MRSHTRFTTLVLLLSAIVLCGCHALQRNSSTTSLQLAGNSSADTAPAGTSGGNPTFVIQVLKNRCTSCHTESGKPENGINYISDLTRLAAMGYIIPGNFKDSEIYKASQGMGAPCTSPKISDEELKEIADYINALK